MSINWIALIQELKPIEAEYVLELVLDRVQQLPEEKRNNLIRRVFSGNNLRLIKKGVSSAVPKQTTSQVNVIPAMRNVRSASK